MDGLKDFKENEAKRILGKNSVTAEEIEKVFEVYGTFDFFNEYLVDGAILTCDQSTRKLKRVKRGGRSLIFSVIDNGIKSGEAQVDADKVLGKLTVTHLEKAKAGDKKYATTVERYYGSNIPCFGNCNNEQYNDVENKKLMEEGVKDNKHGTCKYLISITDDWEDDDLSKEPQKFNTSAGMKDALTMRNSLFCSHGGWIYPVTSGQSDYNKEEAMKFAMSMMDAYLAGLLSEEEVEKAVRFLGLVLPEIAQIEEGWGHAGEDDKFDTYIKAWTHYWNQKIENGELYKDSKIVIRQEVVKAIIMRESSWGTEGDMNTKRDVMQVLHPGDFGLWILSGYDPGLLGMYHQGNDEPKVVWRKDGEDYRNATMRNSFNYYTDDNKPSDQRVTTTEQGELGEGLGILRNNVITVIGVKESVKIQESDAWKKQMNKKNPMGEYLIHYDRVTPNMSIACGVRYLAYKTKEAGGSEIGGVRGYNGKGQEEKTGINDAYAIDINKHLDHLINSDGQPVRRLQE